VSAARVLAFSAREDPAIDYVGTELETRGVELISFNTDEFPTSGRARFHLDARDPDVVFESAGECVAFSELSALWLRRLDVGASLPASMPDAYRQPARAESLAALTGLIATFPGKVVDRLPLIEAAAAKPRQLQLARSLGLSVPRTLITNDPAVAREFAMSCHKGLVAKPLVPLTITDGDGDLGMFTSPVASADLDYLEGLTLCPMVFQERLEKKLEIRATVVGKRVFGAAVDSQSIEASREDWRRAGADLDDAWEPHELPNDVAEPLINLVAAFGLHFSGADIILTPEGRHVFLESNPAGEWVWIENLLGLGIPRAIANELLSV